MASKTFVLRFKIFLLSLLSLSIVLQLLTSIFHLKSRKIPNTTHPINDIVEEYSHRSLHTTPNISSLHDYLRKQLNREEELNIGLVNTNIQDIAKWRTLGRTTQVEFERVSKELKWEDFVREWINEERWPLPICPEVPMPTRDYGVFDVVVARVECGGGGRDEREGIRDVFRLQVNLIVANLVVKGGEIRRPVYVVFVGSSGGCGAMWEIFRCDDMVKSDGDGEVLVYRPDLRRLKQKVLMPVGTCRLALPYVKQGDGQIKYLFSKLGRTIDNPREAYVTVLHSSEDYVCGAIALAQSIIRTKSTKDLVLLADKSITKPSRQALRDSGWKIKHIDRIQSPQAEKDSYNEWNYSKLRIWQLTEYDKVIFIDSDLILLQNIDNFFMSPQLSASSNAKVLFNSGVMLIEPSECTFNTLMKKRHTLVSYNGGDQGFLNEAFTWWHRWPKKSNFLKMFDVNDTKHELPESVYAIHYLGWKPWMCYRDYDCNWDSVEQQVYASDEIHWKWWQVYDSMPRRLQRFCAMSRSVDFRIKDQRRLAKIAKFPDEHWRIKIRDPRRHHLV